MGLQQDLVLACSADPHLNEGSDEYDDHCYWGDVAPTDQPINGRLLPSHQLDVASKSKNVIKRNSDFNSFFTKSVQLIL